MVRAPLGTKCPTDFYKHNTRKKLQKIAAHYTSQVQWPFDWLANCVGLVFNLQWDCSNYFNLNYRDVITTFPRCNTTTQQHTCVHSQQFLEKKLMWKIRVRCWNKVIICGTFAVSSILNSTLATIRLSRRMTGNHMKHCGKFRASC